MCGISAVFLNRPGIDLTSTLAEMNRTQHHRGPDHAGIDLVSPMLALGHTRLSIIDLSERGNQPLRNEDGNIQVICNGEIYNHEELRAELIKKGHRFSSRSDCEVLVHLYEEKGTELLADLRGMFAFVLHDARTGIVFAARDRLGKKPLVYAETATALAIASEIPAIRKVEGVDTTIDSAGLGLFLLRNMRHIPEPYTLYRGIRRLPAGHAFVAREGRINRLWKYWHPSLSADDSLGPDEVRSLFDEAVQLRMVADVEVAALLSGGVDSSAIVERMTTTGSRVRTFAYGRDAQDEELQRARRMSERLGTVHEELFFDPNTAFSDLERLLSIHGEPIALLPLLHAMRLFRAVRAEGIKVVMTGHGADEVFYGYPGFRRLAILSDLLRYLPIGMLRTSASLVSRSGLLPGAGGEAAVVAAAMPGDRKASLYRREASNLWPDLLTEKLNAESVIDPILRTWIPDRGELPYIDEAAIIGLMHENSHSVTIAGDLPAMAESVEVRCPFLDHSLIELALRIPYGKKVRRTGREFQGKLILKEAFARRLPAEVLWASKKGFGYHIQEDAVLRGPWKAALDDTFASPSDLGGAISVTTARRIKKSYDTGGPVLPILMMKLFCLQVAIQQG